MIKLYRTLIAARGILLDENGYIALLYVSKENYYKLPGGELKSGETFEEAFIRECKEETGCLIEISDFLGTIEEDIKDDNIHKVSYLYIGKSTGEKGDLSLTEEEKNRGFKLFWSSPWQAISLMKNSIPPKNIGRIIQERDMEIIQMYLKKIGHEKHFRK